MAEPTAGALSTLAAEIRAELPIIARTVSERDLRAFAGELDAMALAVTQS